MKKIWLVPISRNFDCSCRVLHKPNFHFDVVKSFDPIEPIDEKEYARENHSAFYLMRRMPDGAMEYNAGFESFDILYTDNIEKVRQKWYVGVINSFKHVKWLEDGGLAKMDKRIANSFPNFLAKAEKHREKYPELWI